MTNTFIWADLSTFDVAAAQSFYRHCFSWEFTDSGDDYWIAQIDSQATAALFTMPEMFQRIQMPSFWMSYIMVQNLDGIVERAEALGAKIEVAPQEAPDGSGRIALIRDPAGAGFTCYEGPDLGGRDSALRNGRLVWNELHVSDLGRVREFYETVFDWLIVPAVGSERYEIFTKNNRHDAIAGIQVTSNALKGDKEYWGVYFAVANLDQSAAQILEAGGQIVAEQDAGSFPALLAYDQQGAAFYIIDVSTRRGSVNEHHHITFHWLTVLAWVAFAMSILLWGLYSA